MAPNKSPRPQNPRPQNPGPQTQTTQNPNTQSSNSPNSDTQSSNLNKVKKSKNKKYHVNKIINININNKKKSKTKNSWAQCVAPTKESSFQTYPDKFKKVPVISKLFEEFFQNISMSKTFELFDYFVNLVESDHMKILDKQWELSEKLGNIFKDKETFIWNLGVLSSPEFILLNQFVKSKWITVTENTKIYDLEITKKFINNYFKPDSWNYRIFLLKRSILGCSDSPWELDLNFNCLY